MKNFLRTPARNGSPLRQLSDEELLTEFRKTGNRTLVAELFDRYVHLIYGACRRYTDHEEDCRDLVMTIFEKVLHRAANDEVKAVNSWLYSIANNECISFLRKARINDRNEQEWESFKKNSSVVMENEALLRLYSKENESLSGQNLRLAMAKLEKNQRRCLELFFFERESYQSIARTTGFSLKQVKSYLQNGKRQLRKILSRGIPDSE